MYLNRTVAVVNLKEPFLNWLNSMPENPNLSMDELNTHAHVVLLPDETLDDDETTSNILVQYWERIAEHVFAEWISDESLWPKELTVSEFNDWFDLAIIDSPVADLAEGPLGLYELSEDGEFADDDDDDLDEDLDEDEEEAIN